MVTLIFHPVSCHAVHPKGDTHWIRPLGTLKSKHRLNAAGIPACAGPNPPHSLPTDTAAGLPCVRTASAPLHSPRRPPPPLLATGLSERALGSTPATLPERALEPHPRHSPYALPSFPVAGLPNALRRRPPGGMPTSTHPAPSTGASRSRFLYEMSYCLIHASNNYVYRDATLLCY